MRRPALQGGLCRQRRRQELRQAVRDQGRPQVKGRAAAPYVRRAVRTLADSTTVARRQSGRLAHPFPLLVPRRPRLLRLLDLLLNHASTLSAPAAPKVTLPTPPPRSLHPLDAKRLASLPQPCPLDASLLDDLHPSSAFATLDARSRSAPLPHHPAGNSTPLDTAAVLSPYPLRAHRTPLDRPLPPQSFLHLLSHSLPPFPSGAPRAASDDVRCERALTSGRGRRAARTPCIDTRPLKLAGASCVVVVSDPPLALASASARPAVEPVPALLPSRPPDLPRPSPNSCVPFTLRTLQVLGLTVGSPHSRQLRSPSSTPPTPRPLVRPRSCARRSTRPPSTPQPSHQPPEPVSIPAPRIQLLAFDLPSRPSSPPLASLNDGRRDVDDQHAPARQPSAEPAQPAPDAARLERQQQAQLASAGQGPRRKGCVVCLLVCLPLPSCRLVSAGERARLTRRPPARPPSDGRSQRPGGRPALEEVHGARRQVARLVRRHQGVGRLYRVPRAPAPDAPGLRPGVRRRPPQARRREAPRPVLDAEPAERRPPAHARRLRPHP